MAHVPSFQIYTTTISVMVFEMKYKFIMTYNTYL